MNSSCIKVGWFLRTAGWLLRTAGWLLRTAGWLLRTAGWLLRTAGWLLRTAGWLLRTAGWLLGRLETNPAQRGGGISVNARWVGRGRGGHGGRNFGGDRAGRRGGFTGWHGGRRGNWPRQGPAWKK